MDAIVMNGLMGEEAIACYTERRCNGRIFSFSLLLAFVGDNTNKGGNWQRSRQLKIITLCN